MTFIDFDEDSESDYAPSDEDFGEESEEEEYTSTEELVERYSDEEVADSEEQKQEHEMKLLDDVRWWNSCEDKHRWEKQYHEADAVFRKRFGYGIDTPALPETRRRLRRNKARNRVYKSVLAGLVIIYLVHLVLVYSASLWAFSMLTWRESSTGNNGSKGNIIGSAETSSNGHTDESVRLAAQSSQTRIPDYVRTGLHLCATLSRRVVKSEHDATVTQHALRACNIAVKFAPESSVEAIEAHVLRGDVFSLITRFDAADEDYKAAMKLVLEVSRSGTNPQAALILLQDVNLKALANHWTLLYTAKRFKELRREAKARAVHEHHAGEHSHTRAVSELAANWLSAFKQKKRVQDVLMLQRSYTLRRLNFKALDGDETS